MNVHVYIYRDMDFVQDAVASVRDVLGDVTVYVFDGRHAGFPGTTDLTPGLQAWCDAKPAVEYHAPPDDALPFGHDRDLSKRGAGYEKSRFVFDRLPPYEWTLKLDADERLTTFDVDTSELAPSRKYCPVITTPDDRKYIARLFQPRHWTPWVGDCLVPRAIFPRDIPNEHLHRLWSADEFRVIRFFRRQQLPAVEIENRDHERDEGHRVKRIQQLEARGRQSRADELRKG